MRFDHVELVPGSWKSRLLTSRGDVIAVGDVCNTRQQADESLERLIIDALNIAYEQGEIVRYPTLAFAPR